MVRHLNYHAMKRVGFDYEEMRQDLADLRLSPSNPSGFGIWICNLYTLNSSDVEPVAAWVGLPIDESDMDELLDVLSGDGGDYYIADTRAPTSGLADQIANMAAIQQANYARGGSIRDVQKVGIELEVLSE